MNHIELNTTISRNLDFLVSEMDGKIVMMNIETGKYHGLEGVAATIWGFLENSTQVKAIC